MEKGTKSKLASLFDEEDKNTKHIKTKKTKPKFEQLYQVNSNSFKGLSNFGNACYSNVAIQILTSIDEFNISLQKAYKYIENENDLLETYPITSRLVEVIHYYKSKFIVI